MKKQVLYIVVYCNSCSFPKKQVLDIFVYHVSLVFSKKQVFKYQCFGFASAIDMKITILHVQSLAQVKFSLSKIGGHTFIAVVNFTEV